MSESLASLDELAARIPNGISSTDEVRAQAALNDASELIRAEAGKAWTMESGDPDEQPPAVVATICLTVARRAFINPDGLRSEVTGDTEAQFAESSVYLTKEEKRLVRRSAGRSGLWTQPTTRAEDDRGDVPSVFPFPQTNIGEESHVKHIPWD